MKRPLAATLLALFLGSCATDRGPAAPSNKPSDNGTGEGVAGTGSGALAVVPVATAGTFVLTLRGPNGTTASRHSVPFAEFSTFTSVLTNGGVVVSASPTSWTSQDPLVAQTTRFGRVFGVAEHPGPTVLSVQYRLPNGSTITASTEVVVANARPYSLNFPPGQCTELVSSLWLSAFPGDPAVTHGGAGETWLSQAGANWQTNQTGNPMGIRAGAIAVWDGHVGYVTSVSSSGFTVSEQNIGRALNDPLFPDQAFADWAARPSVRISGGRNENLSDGGFGHPTTSTVTFSDVGRGIGRGFLGYILPAKRTAALQSDLVVEALSAAPTSAAPGTQILVSLRIANRGAGAALPSTARLRLATTSANVTTSDPLLDQFTVNGVAPAEVVQFARTVTIPASRGAGQNYVWLILDVDNEANQNDTGNDRSALPFTVTAPAAQADLVPLNVTVSPSAAPTGSEIAVAYSIRNGGGTNAPVSHTRVQLVNSAGATITEQLYATTSIAAGASVSEVRRLGLAFMPLGAYTAVVRVDASGEVAQSSTANDQGSSPFEIIAGPQQPLATTSDATSTGATTARIVGTVNPGSLLTTAWAEIAHTQAGTILVQTAQVGLPASASVQNVGFDITGLQSGTSYFGRVVATNSQGTSNGAWIQFVTSAPASPPTLFVNVTFFSGGVFSAVTTTAVGSIPGGVTVSNIGGAPLTWTATASVPWITLSQTTSTLAGGASRNVTVSYNLSGVTLGSVHRGTVTFSAPGATGSPVTLTVELIGR